MENLKNIRHFGVLAGLVALTLPSARADEADVCLAELQGSAFAKVLRFEDGVIHIDQKAPRFVKARVVGPQKYLVEYRSNDKPDAPVFTGVLGLTNQGRLIRFVVESPKGETVRKCPAKEETPEAKPTPSPTPVVKLVAPSPTPTSKPIVKPIEKPVEKSVTPPDVAPVEKPATKAPLSPSATAPVQVEIDTAD